MIKCSTALGCFGAQGISVQVELRAQGLMIYLALPLPVRPPPKINPSTAPIGIQRAMLPKTVPMASPMPEPIARPIPAPDSCFVFIPYHLHIFALAHVVRGR